MAQAVLPPLSRTDCRLRSALMTPVLRAEGTRTVVVLRGDADISTKHILSDVISRVIASSAGNVVIDLAEAEFIDTAAVRVLAVAQQLLYHRGRKITFRSPSRLAARVLSLFGLCKLIEAPQRAQP